MTTVLIRGDLPFAVAFSDAFDQARDRGPVFDGLPLGTPLCTKVRTRKATKRHPMVRAFRFEYR